MSTNLLNPADRRTYPARWPRMRGKRLFQEVDERSQTGDEELLSVSHITGITPRSQKNVTMFEAESLVGYKKCKVGDIAANTMWTWQGAIGVSRYDGVVSPAYNVYRQKAGFYHPGYLDLLLRESKLVDVYHSLSTGVRASRLRLYPDVFLTIDFPVPPRDEQEQIVRFLDWKIGAIDYLLSIKEETLALVRELIVSTFGSMTKNHADEVAMKRIMRLTENFFEVDATATYQKAGMYNRGRGIFLREEMEGSDLGDSKFQRIEKNRLMISGQFAWEDAVYITEAKDEEGIVSHRYYLLQAMTEAFPLEYIWAYFISDKGATTLLECSHGAAGRNRPLNIRELMKRTIPVPKDMEKMNLLKRTVRAYMSLQKITENHESIVQEWKTRLISDVVTGKLDVRNIKIPAHAKEA